jgi:hypothetical protein
MQYEIYLITAPGYWYVGSTTVGAAIRLRQHVSGSSGAKKLYAKIQELGVEAFHQVVVEASVGNPIEAEQRWYDFYKAHDARQTLNGKRPSGWDGYMLEHGHSEDTKRRIGDALRGRAQSPELIAKRSAALIGHSISEETRAKINNALTGHIQSEETRAKRSASMKRYHAGKN